jgi:hypothetical protein
VILVFLTMLVILVLALAVVAFVAFPRNGEKVPAAPWLGTALEKTVRSLPTVSEQQHR